MLCDSGLLMLHGYSGEAGLTELTHMDVAAASQPDTDLAHARASIGCTLCPHMLSWQGTRIGCVPASQCRHQGNSPIKTPESGISRGRQGAIGAGQTLPNPFAKALRPRAAPCSATGQKRQLRERVCARTVPRQVSRCEFRVATSATPCTRDLTCQANAMNGPAFRSHGHYSTTWVCTFLPWCGGAPRPWECRTRHTQISHVLRGVPI
jgi:hypothetical protein